MEAEQFMDGWEPYHSGSYFFVCIYWCLVNAELGFSPSWQWITMFTKILARDPCPWNWCLTWWSCFVHGLQISVPKDAFCQVNSQFKIGIPPDAVYDIITDPGNKRVFENIQVTAQWWTPNLFSKTCTCSHLWDYLPFLLATSPSFWQYGPPLVLHTAWSAVQKEIPTSSMMHFWCLQVSLMHRTEITWFETSAGGV